MFEGLLDVGVAGGVGQGHGEDSVLVLTQVIETTGTVIGKVRATLWTLEMTKDALVICCCKVLSRGSLGRKNI